jgi:outer membrane protein assembly factor BamB
MRCLASVVVLLAVGVAPAADWPQWLGPTRDCFSPELVAPWTEAPRVLWRQAVEEGHSSPVVADGKVFVHAKVKDAEAEEVTAYDAETGKQLWHISYPRTKFTSLFGNGPRATPAVSGGRLYTLGATGILTCLDVNGGKQVWQVDTLKEFKAPNLFFGVSCSPLIEGDKVLVNVGGKGASVVAFAKDTGKVVWQSQDDKASYSSPIVFGEGKERQVVFLTGDGVIGLSPADGSLFWRYPLRDRLFESSTTPVRVGDLLLASSITFGSVGLRLQTRDGKPDAAEAWKKPDLTCYFSTPVAVSPELALVVTGTVPSPLKKVEATLRAIEPRTGKELWSKANIGKYHATLLRTGENKVLLLDDAGNLMLLDPSAREYRELSRSKVCGETWAHPALADGRLYVRDNKELICLQIGK